MAISKINTNSIAAGASPTMDDLTLTGSLFLGGTGSANELDDYEEGTWTVATSASGYTISAQSASYVKIGKLVYINFNVTFSAVGASNSVVILTGLPFTVTSSFNSPGACRENTSTGAHYVLQARDGETAVEINSMDGVSPGSQRTIRANELYAGSVTYQID